LLSKRGLRGWRRIYAVTISIVAPYSRWSLLKSRRRALPTEVNIQYPEFPVPAIYCEVPSSLFSYQAVSHFLKTADLETHRILESGCRCCPATSRADLRATDPTARVRALRRYRDQAIANSSQPGCRAPYRPGAVRDLFSNALAFRDSVGLGGRVPNVTRSYVGKDVRVW
jgi:hypothetical protein